MTKLKLPIGVNSFREIREGGYYYVDKTMHARTMMERGGWNFMLFRPRGFGKSLFVDMLKELYEGNEPLFRGLDIHDHWDWSVRHPVVRLVFDTGDYTDPEWLREDLVLQLIHYEDLLGIEMNFDEPCFRFSRIISEMRESTGKRVVFLVDGHTKPIQDAIGEPEAAAINRDLLVSVYGVTKSDDGDFETVLFAGPTAFPRPGIFSGFNNSIDVSIDWRQSGCCGFTEQELDAVFAAELEGLDRDEIRRRYYGYDWSGAETGEVVYNPFEILSAFRKREVRDYWSEELASPEFLVETLLERGANTLKLEAKYTSHYRLTSFDVGDLPTEALLFQGGYMKIEEKTNDRDMGVSYGLRYANREARQDLNRRLLSGMLPESALSAARNGSLDELLAKDDFDGIATAFRNILAEIPERWQPEEDFGNGFFESVFFSWFAAQDMEVLGEYYNYPSWAGLEVRLDDGRVSVFELITVGVERANPKEPGTPARDFAVERGAGHLITVEYDPTGRKITAFGAERLRPA